MNFLFEGRTEFKYLNKTPQNPFLCLNRLLKQNEKNVFENEIHI